MIEKFTVFGGRGFVGSKICTQLKDAGYNVYIPEKNDFSFFTKNLGNVIFAAGLTADFRLRPHDTVEAHVCLINKILREAEFHSLTYLSSTRVYSSSNSTSEDALITVDVHSMSDFYNLTKLTGESICLNSGRDNVKIARLSNVVGFREAPDLFINQLIQEGISSGRILFKTALNSSKDYIYINDVSNLVIKLSLASVTGIFNIAGGRNITHLQIANFIKEYLGFEYFEDKSATTWNFDDIDIRKLKTIIDYKPLEFEDYFPNFLNQYAHTYKA